VGFFALVVLCIEAVLALVVFQVEKATASSVVYVMAGVLVLVVVCVLIIAIRGSEGTRSAVPVDITNQQPARANERRILSHLSDYEVLQRKIAEYADTHRSTRLVIAKGERIIKKGDVAADLFLLEDGNLIIDDETGRPSEEKELKYQGSIVGEAAVVGSNRRRTASVYVYSSQARLVKMSRQAILDLAAYDKDFEKALHYLYRLHASRLEKVALYCGPGVKINTEQCTVLMGDIHGYSRLSEKVTDEMACPFRFKFTNQSFEIASSNRGIFEDQGDGYKVIFRGPDHINRGLLCSLDMQKQFAHLIAEFAQYDDTFREVGLGIGLCTDDFTVLTKPDGMQKILGHSINIAAALSKCRESLDESKIYCTADLIIKIDRASWRFEGPVIRMIEKLETIPQLYILEDRI